MEHLFRSLTTALAMYVEAAGALVIGVAAIEAAVRTVVTFVNIRGQQGTKEQIRLRLGRWLSVALEFELAADILRTAVTPTWNDLGKLAAIVIIRTTINYFLQHDIERASEADPAIAQ